MLNNRRECAHDVDAMDEVMAADTTIRGMPAYDNREELKTYFQALFSAFPDYELSLERIIAEGDTVAFRVSATGTWEGESQGIPPTGAEFEYPASSFIEIEDGKIAHLCTMPTEKRC
ncbi:MAG: nuclear transport factor 2 family protein [Halovenus sp.]